ncbi:predicted protein [Nematostella vectensis]|uniref:G-protein coupled receptors family 1 profile domain-containing protein n=1 Tax=Nematostella vectensis TaxID=45351 RepID=A7RJ35_NEMVE|nr:predicted protein [Nematostella vectensis]|eukprot:XP_001640677.1 predicted protein [Nematostella vectensis]
MEMTALVGPLIVLTILTSLPVCHVQASCRQVCHVIPNSEHHVDLKCSVCEMKSFNNLTTDSEQVQRLLLSENDIHTIERDAFAGLGKLIQFFFIGLLKQLHCIFNGNISRDLKDNPLRTWSTTGLWSQLPRLAVLYLHNNTDFLPTDEIFNLSSLQLIQGLLSSKTHRIDQWECHVWRNFDMEKFMRSYMIKIGLNWDGKYKRRMFALDKNLKPKDPEGCHYIRVTIFNKKVTLFAHYGFSLMCNIKFGRVDASSYYTFEKINLCWEEINQISTVNFFIAIIGFCLNVTVIATTLRSFRLRQNAAIFLMCNIAIGDLQIDVYLLLITSTRRAMTENDYEHMRESHSYFCKVLGFCYMFSLAYSFLVSFLVNIERFLTVVYSMKPNVRLTVRRAGFLLLLCLALSSTITSLTYFDVQISGHTDSMCTPVKGISGFDVRNVYGGIGFVIYAICGFLYFKIYRTVRKSAQTAGVKREGNLARRIALVTLTNLLVLVIPGCVSFIITHTTLGESMHKVKTILWETLTYISFGLNTILNPLLVSFRHKMFQREFVRLWARRNRVGMNHTH